MEKKIAIACDHAALDLKAELMKHLDEQGIEYVDYGTYTNASCNYPDYAEKLCTEIYKGTHDMGILVCGTGIGMSMAANKCKGIRAALCSDTFSARFTRLHNDANVLCMGARTIGAGLACDIMDIFIKTEFEGGRHKTRVDMIMALEDKLSKNS
ncbi:MAG: ribose 5-phosphate isomerase B [Clostridia bacterium]|nr:ribose 5-phosphate isomerase B [Clostridia bacterium]